MVLGIDLGTSNTVAATVSRDGTPVLIPDSYYKQLYSTPSIVLFEGKKAFTGTFSENLYEAMPDKQIISFFKRYFGTQMPVYVDEANNPWFSESIAALILKKIAYDTNIAIIDGYQKTVITVPANYNDIQRKSVLDAARLANIELTAIIEEPVAAALSYGSEGKKKDDEIILVYDFGGGTFDLTLMTQNGNQLNVIAKDGVSNLGGKEFDEIVRNTIIEQYQSAFKKPFPINPLGQNKLQKIAEEIKISLNSPTDKVLLRKWLMVEKDIFECSFSFEKYAQIAQNLIIKTDTAINRCLRSLGMQWSDIDKIILTGGTSNSYLIQQYWQQKILPKQELIAHQPLSSVAKGAALYAESLGNSNGSGYVQRIELKGVSTYNIGLIVDAEHDKQVDLLIHRNSPLPISAKKVYKVNTNTTYLEIILCQYWDIDNVQELGTIKAGPFALTDPMYIEALVENRANGTISVKLKNADNGKDIRVEFVKKKSKHDYDFQQQKALVESVYLNNY